MKSDALNRGFVSLFVALSLALVILPAVQLEPYIKSHAATLKVSTEESPCFVPGQLLVKFKENPASELLHQYHLQLKEQLAEPRFERNQPQSLGSTSRLFLVTFDEARTPQEIAVQLSTQEDVEYAEPNYLYRPQSEPNDPLYPPPPNGYRIDGQWNLGQIGANQLWNSGETEIKTVVGSLDSGIDVTHPDLSGNLWTNPREIANGRDNDGNGYIGDIHGWNFLDNNADIQDRFHHGTETSFAGAIGNNGIGISGIAWRSQIMVLKVGRDTDGYVNTADAVKAIQYGSTTMAREGKRMVFNASWGGPGRSQALADAIRNSGALFVASAGNTGALDPTNPNYPAAFTAELPNVLSVTASTYDAGDPVMSGASYGQAGLAVSPDLAAPGAWIATPEIGGGYAHAGGTSFAAPHVSYAAAWMMDLTGGDVIAARARILKSVDILPALVGKVKTGGRLNIDRAFHGRFNPNQPPTASITTTSFFVGEGDTLPLTVSVSDPDGDPVTVTWDFGDGSHGTGAAVSHMYQNMGIYSIAATATDGLASITVTSTATVTDAVRITQVKLKNYDPVAGTGKKLSVTATDSRQSQQPRPTLTIIGVGEMIYDEDSRAYTFAIKKARNLPQALTIKSSLGGEATRSWQ